MNRRSILLKDPDRIVTIQVQGPETVSMVLTLTLNIPNFNPFKLLRNCFNTEHNPFPKSTPPFLINSNKTKNIETYIDNTNTKHTSCKPL